MLVSTKGIVLHKTKYADTGLIVQIYTREAGVQSFLVKNAFSKRSRVQLALLENLTLVDLTFDDKHEGLKYLRDISLGYHYQRIPFDMVRRSLLIFYNELLYKLLREYQPDTVLFDMLEKAMKELDAEETSLTDVHLYFMVHLIQILGSRPIDNYTEDCRYFSLRDAKFVNEYYDSEDYVSAEGSHYLKQIMRGEIIEKLPNKLIRNELMYALIRYLQQHNEQIYKIESVDILSHILR